MKTSTDRELLPFQQALLTKILEMQAGEKAVRSRPRISRTGALSALAAVAALIAAGSVIERGGQRGPATAPDGKQSLFLADAVASAVEETDEWVLHTVELNSSPGQPDLRFEGWWDSGSDNRHRMVELGADGKPLTETVYRREGDKGILLVIDHATSTWWTRSRDLNLGDGKVLAMAPGPATVRFGKEIQEGEVQIVGEEEVKGVETLHVRDNSKPGVKRDFWILVDSYLPMRRVMTDEFGNRFDMTFEWLPRSESNLRLLEPDLTGFTQVDPPPDASPGPDGGLG